MHTLTIKIENETARSTVVDFLESMKNRGVKVLHDNIDELIEPVTHSCREYEFIQGTQEDVTIPFEEVLKEFTNEH